MPWLPDDNPQEVTDAIAARFLSKWPNPNSARINPFLRMIRGRGLPYPRASRYLLRIQPDSAIGAPILNAWLDVVGLDKDTAEGSTGVNAAGQEIVFTIQQWDDVADPHFGLFGISYQYTYKESGFPDIKFFYMWESPDGSGFLLPESRSIEFPGPSVPVHNPFWTDYDPLVNTNYDPVARRGISFWSLPDCWEFPVVPPPVEGFAEIALDKYITFPADFPHTLGPIRVEFDIYPITLADLRVTTLARFTSFYGGFANDELFRWWDELILMDTPHTTGQWYHYEMERNWSVSDGRWKVWRDGLQVANQVGPNQNNPFDSIGDPRGISDPEFNLRNYLQLSGSPASPITDVDLPLQDNACDAGILMQKGTTFNMTLPSCP